MNDDGEGDLRHGDYRPAGAWMSIRVDPISIRDPSCRTACRTFCPFTMIPLVEPRSTMSICRPVPAACTRIWAWAREMPGSLIRRSASVPRPMTRPGGRSGCRVPLTSSVACEDRVRVRWSLSVTLAWALLRIRKRPVVRSSADSKAMEIGPVKT